MNVRQLAEKLGLSSATISRALRSEGKVSAGTREKVLKAAQEMGYEPNPLIGRMMSSLRRQELKVFRGNLALLVKNLKPGLLSDARCEEVVGGAMKQAKELGFSLDRIDLDTAPARSIEKVLYSRCVSGIIAFMPSLAGEKVTVEMDFSSYCCVSAGWGLWHPELDVVQADYHHQMRLALNHTAPRFGRGIAAIWDYPTDAASHHVARGAFLTHHPGGMALAEKLFVSRDSVSRLRLGDIAKRHAVSCLILGSSFVPPEWLPEVVPAANWVWCRNPGKRPHFGRIDPKNSLLGRWAVNLLAAKVQLNQTGLPANRQTVLVPAVWRPGGTE